MIVEHAYYNFGRLDRLSHGDTLVHRLDPRAKVVATMLFIITVISYPKYDIAPIVPYVIFPITVAAMANIPFDFLARYLLFASPFAVIIGIFNPIFDSHIVTIAGVSLSAGWISFLSILLKFGLTLSASILLVATTSFAGVSRALRDLGFPALFVSQLLFLYRYLFVLFEEVVRMIRARELRSYSGRGRSMRITARIIGSMLIKTVERAERIYTAMLCRGFKGDVPLLKQPRFGLRDVIFLSGVAAILLLFRFFPITETIGGLVQGLL